MTSNELDKLAVELLRALTRGYVVKVIKLDRLERLVMNVKPDPMTLVDDWIVVYEDGSVESLKWMIYKDYKFIRYKPEVSHEAQDNSDNNFTRGKQDG